MPIIISNEKETIKETLEKHKNDATTAWNNFLDYLNKKIPKAKNRTEANIKNEWQNFFEKDENVPYAPTEKILNSLYNDWISHINENKDIIAAGKENLDKKVNNAIITLSESMDSKTEDKNDTSKNEVLDNSSDDASKAWSKFIEYYEKKYPNPIDRTAANIRNEYKNFFEKDENVPYAPTELILDKMLEDWIKEIETNPEAVKNGGNNIEDKTNVAVNKVKEDVAQKEEDNDDEDDEEEDPNPEKVITFGSKASAITTSDVQKELLNTPFAVPYVTSYQKKVVDGKEIISSAVLKRYYSSIDAEIYFGHEYVDDVCNIDWNIQQKTMPLYGYNSYKYDEVAQGNRIVSGTFDINFTSPNYLFKILKAASKVQNAVNYGNQDNFRIEMPNNIKAATIDNTLTTYNHKGYQLAPIYNTSFDIDVVFGNYKDQEGSTPVHIILEDVWIQASSMVLSASAAESPPTIKERYSFIARDIRTYVGTVTQEEQKGYTRKK